VGVKQERDPEVHGDGPTWIEPEATQDLRNAAAGLLAPDFRITLGERQAGPLLARTMRGGLFSLFEAGEEVPRRALEVGVASNEEEAQPAGAHELPPHPGFARVFETGRVGDIQCRVVERVHGWPLRVLLGRRGLAFTGRRLAALGAEIADALDSLRGAPGVPRRVHGRLSVGHLMIDVTGRARIVGSPVRPGGPGLMPDAIGLGATLACAALASTPDPRGLTPAAIRALGLALERPENAARVPPGLRRLIQSLLQLNPRGFLPSMGVLRAEFVKHMGGLPMGVPDPAWGRALNDAVTGIPPEHRPTVNDAEWVVRALVGLLPELAGGTEAAPPPPGGAGLGPPRLQLVHGAELPELGVESLPRPARPVPFPLLVRG
jgi:hypothetical protein